MIIDAVPATTGENATMTAAVWTDGCKTFID
jgi:hypothetical protein